MSWPTDSICDQTLSVSDGLPERAQDDLQAMIVELRVVRYSEARDGNVSRPIRDRWKMSGELAFTDPNAEASAGWSAATTRAGHSAPPGLDGTGGAGPTASTEGVGIEFSEISAINRRE